jgi:hypothetical protein
MSGHQAHGLARRRRLSEGEIRRPLRGQADAAIKRLQKKHGLVVDGIVGYMTFKVLVTHTDAFASKLIGDFEKERIGDWGIIGRKAAFAGLDMGVDFLGAGPIPRVPRWIRARNVVSLRSWEVSDA